MQAYQRKQKFVLPNRSNVWFGCIPRGKSLLKPPIGRRSYDKYLVQRARQLIQSKFDPKTWQACWAHAAEGRSAGEVARELGMSENAVRLAKFRVIRRLRRTGRPVYASKSVIISRNSLMFVPRICQDLIADDRAAEASVNNLDRIEYSELLMSIAKQTTSPSIAGAIVDIYTAKPRVGAATLPGTGARRLFRKMVNSTFTACRQRSIVSA